MAEFSFNTCKPVSIVKIPEYKAQTFACGEDTVTFMKSPSKSGGNNLSLLSSVDENGNRKTVTYNTKTPNSGKIAIMNGSKVDIKAGLTEKDPDIEKLLFNSKVMFLEENDKFK